MKVLLNFSRYYFIIVSIITLLLAHNCSTAQKILFHLSEGEFVVDTDGLSVSLLSNQDPINFIAKNKLFSESKTTLCQKDQYIVEYETIKLLIEKHSDNEIKFIFCPKKNNIIKWPIIQENSALETFVIPQGEGLFVPKNDQILRSILTQEIFDHSHMLPFVGLLYKNVMLTVIHHDPYRSSFIMYDIGGGGAFSYDFRKRDKYPSFSISLIVSKPSLLGSAQLFRKSLEARNQLVSLKDKIRLNKNVLKLAGAPHIYVWGTGRTLSFLDQLQSLGIHSAWIGYEEKFGDLQQYVTPGFIHQAEQQGYLVGPYDSFDTIQPPDQADCSNTNFGQGYYPEACIVTYDGSCAQGFAGRGCKTSMMALKQEDNEIIKHRIEKFKQDGINSYFLDCYGMLEVRDDYSAQHPQTVFEDAQIRISHLEYISSQSLVLGSETATTPTIAHCAFSHGNFSTLYCMHYESMKNKASYGGWYPAERPAIFFKSLSDDKKVALRYAPEYRLPLFQTVFHDCIVATDRWDAPITKYPALCIQRLMLEFLYGVPSIWSLDIEQLQSSKELLSFLAQEFYELHSKIMTLQLTNFAYLTTDRKVQRVVFGENEVIIIGNFSDTPYDKIPLGSLAISYNQQDYKILDMKALSN